MEIRRLDGTVICSGDDSLKHLAADYKLRLAEADLRAVDLSRCDLSGANLRGANLSSAEMGSANLFGAYLQGAILDNAWFDGARLGSANLYAASCHHTRFTAANLSYADFRAADCSGASFKRANLFGADFYKTILVDAVLPYYELPEGDLIGYKKLHGGVICKLLIGRDVPRTASLVGNKCRAASAVVLEGHGYSSHDSFFLYTVGETVTPDSYDPDPRIECSNGIHFFRTRREAEDYEL